MLVRSYPGVPSSTFSIGPMAEVDIDVAVDDILFNLMTNDTQLIRGSTPSRRGRKKDPLLLQLLIESTMQVGDMFFVILVFTQ
jgi:hypothetical protein